MLKYLSNIDQVLQTESVDARAVPGGLVRAVRDGRACICWDSCAWKEIEAER